MEPCNETEAEEDRRDFLKKCGRFAVITPPAVTFLLSTSMSSKAIAASSGRAFPTGAAVGVVTAGAGVTVVAVDARNGQNAPGEVAPVSAPAAPPAAPPSSPSAPVAPTPPGFGLGERG